jgi:integrase
MKTISYSFVLRTDRSSEKKPLNIIVYCNGKQHRFSIPKKLNPKNWDSKHQRAKMNFVDWKPLNKILDNYESIISKYIYDCEIKKQTFSIERLRQMLFNEDYSESFISFIRNDVENNHTFSAETLRTNKSYITKFGAYRPMATLSEANTIEYINGYEKFCIDRGNNKSTISKGKTMLKKFLQRAVDQELLEFNVFHKHRIKIPGIEGNRNFLDTQELSSLISLYEKATLPDYLQNVLRIFLFTCFTGLRYIDIKNLKWANIQNGFLVLNQHKTGEALNNPIPERALFLLPKAVGVPNDCVFRVPTNQVYNRFIKIIMAEVGITKIITGHCARHTLATLMLSAGVQLEVTSKLMGHTSARTTAIYTKVLNQSKIDATNVWDRLV